MDFVANAAYAFEEMTEEGSITSDVTIDAIKNLQYNIIYAHPETLLGKEGTD